MRLLLTILVGLMFASCVAHETIQDSESIERAKESKVSDIVSNIQTFDGKTVSVNGKVVKVLRNVLGKDWLHLQDDTGTSAVPVQRLIVIMKQTNIDFAKGDILLVNGLITANKDVGSGNVFEVVMEEAEIRK